MAVVLYEEICEYRKVELCTCQVKNKEWGSHEFQRWLELAIQSG